MTDEEEKKIDQERRNNLLVLALKQAKSGEKFISGSKLRNRRDRLTQKTEAPPKPKKFVIKEVPKLQDIKDLDADAVWTGRDWLYEIALISLVDKTITIMRNIGAKNGLIDALKDLLEAMKNGDSEDTKKKLHILTEDWGATTSTTDRQNYHLLRAVIRIIYSTYPLE